jgi:hypothetical protein
MQLVFRKALLTDIPGLVSMLSDDELGALREDGSRPLNQKYLQAFAEIESDANNLYWFMAMPDRGCSNSFRSSRPGIGGKVFAVGY